MSEFNPQTQDHGGADRLLKDAPVGRLATCRGSEPYVVPVSFVYENGRIIVHGSAKGKKMDNITSNPKVCFEVDESEFVPDEDPCKLHWKYRSVVAAGTARVLEDPEEIVAALKLLVDKYAPGKGSLITRERTESYENLALVEIVVDELTEKKVGHQTGG